MKKVLVGDNPELVNQLFSWKKNSSVCNLSICLRVYNLSILNSGLRKDTNLPLRLIWSYMPSKGTESDWLRYKSHLNSLPSDYCVPKQKRMNFEAKNRFETVADSSHAIFSMILFSILRTTGDIKLIYFLYKTKYISYFSGLQAISSIIASKVFLYIWGY